MKVYKASITLLLLFPLSSDGFSYTRIYLMSDVTVNTEDVRVSDICKTDGDNTGLVSDMIIPHALYIDKIIDNKELLDFLNSNLNEKVFVFGTGVKIKHTFNFKSKQNQNHDKASLVKPTLIKRGDTLTLFIRKNGIIIEVQGKALSNGDARDEVNFKLLSGKVIKGKIISDKEADVIL